MPETRASAYWRLKWAFIGAAVALVLVGLTWTMTALVKSPQDALASAKPPAPSVITVPIEQKTLSLDVTVDGQLKSPTEATGLLGTDDRERAKSATQVVVSSSAGDRAGILKGISADGRFSLTLASPLTASRAESGAVTVTFKSDTAPVESLVVPISALFTSSGGRTAVVRQVRGVQQQVEVTMGANVDGFVAISTKEPGELAAGDEVLVSEPANP